MPSGVSADTGEYPSEVPVALSRKSFPPRRQFTRRARCSCSAGPPGSDHVGGVAKSSATSETTSTSTTALARCETRPHNRGRCPGLDCRIPIQQQHPRPRHFDAVPISPADKANTSRVNAEKRQDRASLWNPRGYANNAPARIAFTISGHSVDIRNENWTSEPSSSSSSFVGFHFRCHIAAR